MMKLDGMYTHKSTDATRCQNPIRNSGTFFSMRTYSFIKMYTPTPGFKGPQTDLKHTIKTQTKYMALKQKTAIW